MNIRLDDDDAIKNDCVKFQPFVGSAYHACTVKILLLGESHYGDESKYTPSFTQDVVNRYLLNGENPRFFNGMLRTIFGKPFDRNQIENFCFYNYIQEFVGETPRIRPTVKQWNAAEAPLEAVVQELEPDIVLCFGLALYSHLPRAIGYPGESFGEIHSWIYPYGKDVPVFPVRHPSSVGYSWGKYHALLKEIPQMKLFY